MKSYTSVLLLIFSIFSLVVASNIVFAESENWNEVTRFSGGGGIGTTEQFTCDHVEWRIRWEYEPRTDNPEASALQFYIYTQEFQGPWFESLIKWGTEETNGTLYIHDKNGTFHLDVLSSVPSYTLIIEQNLDSIPEFPSWIILPLCVATTLTVIIYRKRLAKNPLVRINSSRNSNFSYV